MASKLFTAIVLAALLVLPGRVPAQQPPPATGTITIEELSDRIFQAESGLIARMRAFRPIVEVYAQTVEPHERLGTVPVKDEYFLGQFEWNAAEGPKIKRLTPEKGTRQQMAEWLSRPFAVQLRPDGFAAMAAPDWRILGGQRYTLTFVRREFLGEVRCLVLDVMPRAGSQEGFTGRIWVEDREFNIVRFNGITRALGVPPAGKKRWFNVDSWRLNVLPSLWLPAYVYAELADDESRDVPQIKSQVRFWGYDLKSVRPAQEFTTIRIDEPAVADNADRPQQLSPTASQRLWEQQAEDNVLDRLLKAGLLAPPSDVDKVLETVLQNLQITNSLALDPPLKARVLLTSPLESFTIGRTIVLSRGLVDVLPDEASLAMVLAHELSHVALGHRVIDTRFAFADKLMVPDDELLGTVRYQHDYREETAADAQVIAYLRNSPYRDRLSEAGLFLRAVFENSRKLKNLVQPHIGEQAAEDVQARRASELIQTAPALAPERLDQIAALPLGGRIAVDPWSGHVELMRTATVPLASAREKAALAVTPLVPYLRYAEPKGQAQ